METRETLAFPPIERCGQGPYRVETESVRAHLGEELIVYACGQHAIAGNYRLAIARKDRPVGVDEHAFGMRSRDNAACKDQRNASRATVSASSGTGTGSGTAGFDGSSRAGAGGSAAPASWSSLGPTALRAATVVPDSCVVRTPLFDTEYRIDADDIALDAHLTLDIWSDEPNDFEGLVFVIEKRAVITGTTLEGWSAYHAAYEDWQRRWNAFVDGEVTAGRTELFDARVKTPPPPPARAELQPPRPSTHARWIAGYWQYGEGSFHWLSGLWDVPEEDIQRDLTVHAPTPPPAPKPERPGEQRPMVTAVWTPGQWQWDGRVYVWVAGAWRIPPSQNHTWKPAVWSVSARGTVFIPGGWTVRIGRYP